jgi:hypothetical protein
MFNKIAHRFGPLAWVWDPNGQATTPGDLFFASQLDARVLRTDSDGLVLDVLDERDLGSGLVTTAGVNLMATDWNASANEQVLKLANYHHSGTGSASPAIGDTTLGTAVDSRATGTQSNPASGQYRTVATCTYSTSRAIQEWGLFTATPSGGTLWDRRTFTTINADASTSIEFTYTLTINAGG